MRRVAAEVVGSDGSRSVVCQQCSLADRPMARLVGLLGRRSLPEGEGLLLRPSNGVHTGFMRFAIDLVFMDGEGVVLAVRSNVRPWRVAIQRGARGVLELPAGSAERHPIRAGDRLELV